MSSTSDPGVAVAARATDVELDDLALLEAEAIHVIREVAAEFERPVLLFSGGKDSVVMLHLALKAFRPCALPFPVMHVDTGHNFDEVIEFRDRTVAEHGLRLVVASVEDSIRAGRASTSGSSPCRTGPSSTSGATSPPTTSSCRRSTTPTAGRCSGATACGWRCRPT